MLVLINLGGCNRIQQTVSILNDENREIIDSNCSQPFQLVAWKNLMRQNKRICDRCWACTRYLVTRTCKGCKQRHYCSQQCQLQDWKVYGHRNVCSQKRSNQYTMKMIMNNVMYFVITSIINRFTKFFTRCAIIHSEFKLQ